jgi:hypothetical protein
MTCYSHPAVRRLSGEREASAIRQPPALAPAAERIPRATIRLRHGRKALRHGMTLGWRIAWDGSEFPVTVTKLEPKEKTA